MFRPRRPRARRLLVGALAIPVAIAVTATAAHADTSTAEASAFNLSIFGAPVPAPATASNDGTQPTQTAGFAVGGISLLPPNSIVQAGALGQLAVANPDGSSAACSGLIAPSAAIAIAPNGTCSAGNNTNGVLLNLLGVASLTAGSLTAQCTADSAGNVAGSATLANAVIKGPFGIPTLNLPLNPAPNTGISFLGINILMNKQVINPDGSITVTALEITVLGTGIEVGKVTCGPNIAVVDGPMVPGLPAEGTALAAGALAAVAGAVGVRRTRRNRLPVAG